MFAWQPGRAFRNCLDQKKTLTTETLEKTKFLVSGLL